MPAALLLLLASCGDEKPDTVTNAVCPALDLLEGRSLSATGTTPTGNSFPQSTTLTAAGSPWIINGYFMIGQGVTVTVEPCAVVELARDASLAITGGGNLVAAGSADEPILFTGSEKTRGYWRSIDFELPGDATRLAHVTFEYGGTPSGGLISMLHFNGDDRNAPKIQVNDVTVRHSASTGVVLVRQAEFGPGSANLVITDAASYPLQVCELGARSIPTGSYTGNGDDRIFVSGSGSTTNADVVRWPNRGLPYHYEVYNATTWRGQLVLDPGLHVYVKQSTGPNGLISFVQGGSLIADGGSEAGRILIEGDVSHHASWTESWTWAGLEFASDAAPSTLNFVTIRGAGGFSNFSSPACMPPGVDFTKTRAAMLVSGANVLSMTNTTIEGTGETTWGVSRNYYGDGTAKFSISTGNVFKAPMACPETDQRDNAASCSLHCCQHDYACHGTVTP